MKKFYYTCASLFLLIVFGACEDFLEKEPLAQITPENYFWAESELAAYAINQYSFSTPGTKMGEKGGPQYADTDTDNQADLSVENKWHPGKWKVGSSGGNWSFGKIFDCNYFLDIVVPRWEAGEITGDADNVKHYIGEMYFLRAYEYFNKLKAFGDFPIIEHALPDDESALIEASKRMPQNEVARFIIKDLDTAIGLLKEKAPGGTNRISRNVALLLKSRVALYEGTWLKYHANTARVPLGPGWPGKDREYNKGYQFPAGNLEKETEYFLDECMKSAKEVADKIKLTENNGKMNETSEAGNKYYDMFAKTDLSSYPEVLLWRAYNVSLVAHSMNHFLQYGGGGNGFTRSFVDCFLMKNGLPIYADGADYAGDDFIGDVKKNRDSRLVLFMKAPGETLALTGTSKNQNVLGFMADKEIKSDIVQDMPSKKDVQRTMHNKNR